MEIVKNSAKDCYPAVQKTTLVIMERLQQVLQMEVRGGGVYLYLDVFDDKNRLHLYSSLML